MNIRVLMACGLCLFPAAAKAQAPADTCGYTLRVQLVETHTFQPVADAVIFLEAGIDGYPADAAGMVTIPGLCAGRQVLHIQSPLTGVTHDTVTLTGSIQVRIRLPHVRETLQGVTVHAERTPTVLQAKTELSREALAAGAGKGLAEQLRQLNGVSVLSTGATVAKPVIHGLHSNRILILNNGIRQEDQQWGSEHAPNIDPFLANKITVIKGAASVRYGTDAIGGVVLVTPAPLRHQPGLIGESNLAAFSNNRMGVAELSLEGALRRRPQFALRVQGSVKKGGNYRIPGYWAANTGVQETNYSATLGWQAAHQQAELYYSHFEQEIGIYQGSHTGSREDFLNAIASPGPTVPADFTYAIDRPRQHVRHDLLKATYRADTRAGQLSLTYAFQHNFRQEYDVTRIERGNAQLNLTLRTHTLNLNLDHRLLPRFSGQVGVDGVFQEHFFRNGDRLFIPNFNSAGGGAYWLERWQKDKWQVEGGLRYDYRWFEVFNNEGSNQQVVRYAYAYQSLSGTAGARYRATDRLETALTFATAWRAPQSNELFSAGLHHGAARIELGDKDLKPERSFGLNGDLNWQPDDGWRLQLGLYSQFISDYIYLEPGTDVLTIRGYFKTFRYQQTNAWLNGADLTLERQWNKVFQSTLKAATVLGRDVRRRDWLILMPQDQIRLETKAEGKVWGLNNAFASLTGSYTARQQRLPANFDEVDYPRPPQGYFLLDAAVGANFQIGSQPVHASLGATNLLNQRYREYLDAFRYFLDRPGTDIVLRLRVPFH